MKKFVVFLLVIVVLIAAVRVVFLQYEEHPEKFAWAEEWIEPVREKWDAVYESVEQLPQQDWTMESNYDINEENWFAEDEAVYSDSMEYTRLSQGEITGLKLNAAGCQIRVVASEEADFFFEFQNMKKVQAYQKDDTVFVNAVRDTEIEKEIKGSSMTIYIPAGCYLELAEIELGAGSIEADIMNAGELALRVGAGKVTIHSVNAENLKVSLGAGAVVLQDASVGCGEISVGAGGFTLDGQIDGDMEAKCTMGNIDMQLQGSEQVFNYDIQCVAGNVQINEEKYSGMKEELKVDNSAEKTLDLHCAMGNINVLFQE